VSSNTRLASGAAPTESRKGCIVQRLLRDEPIEAENLIDMQKTQSASDRTSCRSLLADQTYLVLHTGPYRLIRKFRVAFRGRRRPVRLPLLGDLRARLSDPKWHGT
jgi:hypothetical protein